MRTRTPNRFSRATLDRVQPMVFRARGVAEPVNLCTFVEVCTGGRCPRHAVPGSNRCDLAWHQA